MDACGVFLILFIEALITDTAKTYSIKALLNCGVTGSFINKDFVWAKGINIQSISHPIPVFNIDRSFNKAGQISKVVDIVLWYNSHLEWILLAVSSLERQNLILGYSWLKDHNPEINWQKGEVLIT